MLHNQIFRMFLSIFTLSQFSIYAVELPPTPQPTANIMTNNQTDAHQLITQNIPTIPLTDKTSGDLWREQAISAYECGFTVIKRWDKICKTIRLIRNLNSFPQNLNPGLKNNLDLILNEATLIENSFIKIIKSTEESHSKNSNSYFSFRTALKVPYRYTMVLLGKCQKLMSYPILYSYPEDKDKADHLKDIINYFNSGINQIIENLTAYSSEFIDYVNCPDD